MRKCHPAAGLLLVAWVLTGCAPSAVVPDVTTSAGSTPTATAQGDGQAAIAVPRDCLAIENLSAFPAELVGGAAPNTSYELDWVPAGPKAELICSWVLDGSDTTGLHVEYGSSSQTEDVVAAALEAQGFTCSQAVGGSRCERVTPNSYYPTDVLAQVLVTESSWVALHNPNVELDVSGLLEQLAS